MNLSVLDRLMILTALPGEGDYASLKILMNLRMSLSFTEDEVKEFGLDTLEDGTGTKWEKNGEVEIPIGEKATDIIVDAFKMLDKQKKLMPDMMGVYEKFIPTT